MATQVAMATLNGETGLISGITERRLSGKSVWMAACSAFARRYFCIANCFAASVDIFPLAILSHIRKDDIR